MQLSASQSPRTDAKLLVPRKYIDVPTVEPKEPKKKAKVKLPWRNGGANANCPDKYKGILCCSGTKEWGKKADDGPGNTVRSRGRECHCFSLPLTSLPLTALSRPGSRCGQVRHSHLPTSLPAYFPTFLVGVAVVGVVGVVVLLAVAAVG